MLSVHQANIGAVQVSCPWCIHKYPFSTEIIVSEEQIPMMFYRLKAAYERMLYLQNYDAARIAELTRLEQPVIIKKRRAEPAKPAPVEVVDPIPSCSGMSETCSDNETETCSLEAAAEYVEDTCHCPV